MILTTSQRHIYFYKRKIGLRKSMRRLWISFIFQILNHRDLICLWWAILLSRFDLKNCQDIYFFQKLKKKSYINKLAPGLLKYNKNSIQFHSSKSLTQFRLSRWDLCVLCACVCIYVFLMLTTLIYFLNHFLHVYYTYVYFCNQ